MLTFTLPINKVKIFGVNYNQASDRPVLQELQVVEEKQEKISEDEKISHVHGLARLS